MHAADDNYHVWQMTEHHDRIKAATMVGSFAAASFVTTAAAFVDRNVLVPTKRGAAVKEISRRKLPISSLSRIKNDDDDEPPSDSPASKPKSRLAQLAEDWLEEEDDELQMYWERFEENKGNNEVISVEAKDTSTDDDDSNLTTEQRLERYFDSRGIHKSNERKYAPEIEEASAKAKSAPTPEEAIAALSPVQPYLQVRTRLGGLALYELALALWQRDGEPDQELLRELIQKNTHVKQKVQQLARRKSPPKRSPSTNTFWEGLLDSNQWWN